MAFDGLVTGAVSGQLSRALTGGKIEKIYHPEPDELILHIQRGREKHRLYISASSSHPRMHLMEAAAGDNPKSPTAFCMLLRKHFQGGRIAEIRQVESERIVELYVDTIDEMGFSVNRKLVVEIMGKHSNIIAVDLSNEKILDCIKRVSLDVSRVRQLLPGLAYQLPPNQGKVCFYTLTEEQVNEIASQGEDSLEKALVSRVQGISPAFARHLVRLKEDGADLYARMRAYSRLIREGELCPVVYRDPENVPVEFHVFPLSTLDGFYKCLPFPDPSMAVEYYYSHKDSSNRMKQKAADLSKAIRNSLDKQYLKKQRLLEDLLKAENSDDYRLYGELLTASLHSLPQGGDRASVFNYYDETMIEIPLDPRYSPAKNAQRYFKKYAKAKTAVKEKTHQLSETNEIIDYLESVLVFVENAEAVSEIEEIRQELVEGGYLRKRKNAYKSSNSKPKSNPYAYATSDGFRLLVGRNNRENDILTFKTADKKDIWLHTKDIPGSHVILFTEGRQPSEKAIWEAAALAAYFSKGRTSENVPVDYTRVRHVKKPAGAKPGMVIFTDNRTVYVHPALPATQER